MNPQCQVFDSHLTDEYVPQPRRCTAVATVLLTDVYGGGYRVACGEHATALGDRYPILRLEPAPRVESAMTPPRRRIIL